MKTPPLPKSLHEYRDSLREQGFEEFDYKYTGGFITQKSWVYFLPDLKVYAYFALLNDESPLLGFSSYFEKGFLLTTFYNWGGALTESSKILEANVKTSFQAALDYHLHQSQKHLLNQGQTVSFSDIAQQSLWEKKHNISGAETRAMFYGLLKGFARGLGTAFVMYLIYHFFVHSNPAIQAMDKFYIFVVTVEILPLLVGVVPTFFRKSVEDRKKKKNNEDLE